MIIVRYIPGPIVFVKRVSGHTSYGGEGSPSCCSKELLRRDIPWPETGDRKSLGVSHIGMFLLDLLQHVPC